MITSATMPTGTRPFTKNEATPQVVFALLRAIRQSAPGLQGGFFHRLLFLDGGHRNWIWICACAFYQNPQAAGLVVQRNSFPLRIFADSTRIFQCRQLEPLRVWRHLYYSG